ncbi:ABC transporter ATP-binding protein [Metabacillus malikii]
MNIDSKKIGIIGENGIGKTTMLKLMSGQLVPQSGQIALSGDTYFVHFDLFKYKKFTLRDMLDLCMHLESFNCTDYMDYVKALHITSYMDVPIGKLSKGTIKKVALLFGFLSVHPILLIDEPFESLDKASNKNIIRLFNEEERGLVIVSHDLDMLQQSVDKIYHLNNKGLTISENDVLL